MARYTVTLVTSASTVVEVDVPDDVTDPEEIAALALEQNNEPDLCRQCSHAGGQELYLGDEWEPNRFDGALTITKIG
ncbi:hypothetical protein [Kitasatospora sp. NPDC004289]